MSSGWDVYYVVFLSALLALGIPLSLSAISSFVAVSQRTELDPQRIELLRRAAAGNTVLGKRMNTRFFLAANCALLLIASVLALIPCAVTIAGGSQSASQNASMMGVVAIVSIAGFAALGLLYSSRKGDLSWLRAFSNEEIRMRALHVKRSSLGTPMDLGGGAGARRAPPAAGKG